MHACPSIRVVSQSIGMPKTPHKPAASARLQFLMSNVFTEHIFVPHTFYTYLHPTVQHQPPTRKQTKGGHNLNARTSITLITPTNGKQPSKQPNPNYHFQTTREHKTTPKTKPRPQAKERKARKPEMQTSGLTNTPLTKLLLIYILASSIALSIFDIKHLAPIHISPHFWVYDQFWRALLWQLAGFTNSTDALFAAMLVYHLRVVERAWGARKLAVCKSSNPTPFRPEGRIGLMKLN
jgi:hypothetical protein